MLARAQRRPFDGLPPEGASRTSGRNRDHGDVKWIAIWRLLFGALGGDVEAQGLMRGRNLPERCM